MNEPYDTMTQCSKQIGIIFEREKDRYVELQTTNADLLEALEDCSKTLLRLRERGTIGDSPSIRLANAAIAKAKEH